MGKEVLLEHAKLDSQPILTEVISVSTDFDIEPTNDEIASENIIEQNRYEPTCLSNSDIEELLENSRLKEKPDAYNYWNYAVSLPLLPEETTKELIKEQHDLSQKIEFINDSSERTTYLARLNEINTTIISHNSRLILWMVKRFIPPLIKTDMTVQDGLQVGSVGMLRAIKKFDLESNFKFSTYATWNVRNSIQRSIYNGGMIRHPVPVHEQLNQLRHVLKQANKSDAPLDRYTNTQIQELANTANQLGYNALTTTHIQELLGLKTLNVLSSDQTINSESELTIADTLANEDDTEEEAIHIAHNKMTSRILEELFMQLDFKEAYILRLYYGLEKNKQELTFEEIGEKFGLTRQRIQQIEAQARVKLRDIIQTLDSQGKKSIMKKLGIF
ncbi:hypothetical protein BH09PAT2_BH09PAT2_06570 [soil metagenome]